MSVQDKPKVGLPSPGPVLRVNAPVVAHTMTQFEIGEVDRTTRELADWVVQEMAAREHEFFSKAVAAERVEKARSSHAPTPNTELFGTFQSREDYVAAYQETIQALAQGTKFNDLTPTQQNLVGEFAFAARSYIADELAPLRDATEVIAQNGPGAVQLAVLDALIKELAHRFADNPLFEMRKT